MIAQPLVLMNIVKKHSGLAKKSVQESTRGKVRISAVFALPKRVDVKISSTGLSLKKKTKDLFLTNLSLQKTKEGHSLDNHSLRKSTT